MRINSPLLGTMTGLVGALVSVTAVSAADLYAKAPSKVATPLVGAATAPAVDGINGKIDGFGGSIADRSVYGVKGALSVPLGGQLGLQVDGAAGNLDTRSFGSVAGHLFWRDPGQALLGVYVNHTRWDRFGGVHVTQLAGEQEYYWGRFTLQGIAGVELGNRVSNVTTATSVTPQVGGIPGVATTTTFIEGYDVRTRLFDQVNLKYYLTDDWDAYVGHRYLGGRNALALGTEASLAIGRGVMTSAFLEGRVGQGDFHGIWGGLRFYFGQKDKPLVARHRQDDPTIWGVDSLFSITNSHVQSGSSTSSSFCSNGALDGNRCFFDEID